MLSNNRGIARWSLIRLDSSIVTISLRTRSRSNLTVNQTTFYKPHYRESRRPVFPQKTSIYQWSDSYRDVWLGGRNKCHVTLNFPTYFYLFSSTPSYLAHAFVHSGFYHRFSFSDRTGSPDVWRIFLAASSLFMGSTPRARHQRTKACATGDATRTSREEAMLVNVSEGVWTVGILRGIFIALVVVVVVWIISGLS